MHQLNLWASWIGVFLGMASGAGFGLFFAGEQWLGGYGSWRRRLVRLGHISFFGLAIINLMFAVTVRTLLGPVDENSDLLAFASWALVAGAVLMPSVCFLAAWRKPLRHLFFLPVGALLFGVGALLFWGVTR